ncbi:MAG: hypothetical protein AAF636_18645 [Pseudomonadota bacterium]
MRFLIGKPKLLSLKILNSLFQRLDDRRVGRVHDPVQRRLNLAVHLTNLALKRMTFALGGGNAHFPGIHEHGLGNFDNLTGGL